MAKGKFSGPAARGPFKTATAILRRDACARLWTGKAYRRGESNRPAAPLAGAAVAGPARRAAGVWALILAGGYFLYGQPPLGLAMLAIAVVDGVIVAQCWKRLSFGRPDA